MPVPDNDLRRAALDESLNRSIDFASKKRAHFGIFWVCLVLPADAGDTFSVSDHKDSLILSDNGRLNQKK